MIGGKIAEIILNESGKTSFVFFCVSFGSLYYRPVKFQGKFCFLGLLLYV